MKLYRIISPLTFTQNITKVCVIQPEAKSQQKHLLEVMKTSSDWSFKWPNELIDNQLRRKGSYICVRRPSHPRCLLLRDDSSVQSLLLYYPLVFIYGFVSRETTGSVTHNIRMGTRGSDIERPDQQIHEYKSICLHWLCVSYYTLSRCCSAHNENMMTGLNEYNSNHTSVQSLKDLYLLSPLVIKGSVAFIATDGLFFNFLDCMYTFFIRLMVSRRTLNIHGTFPFHKRFIVG